MAQKTVENIFKILGKKYNLPINVIEECYLSEFKKIKEEMSSLDFKILKLPSFGKYIPSQKKLLKSKEYYQEKKIKKTNKLENNE